MGIRDQEHTALRVFTGTKDGEDSDTDEILTYSFRSNTNESGISDVRQDYHTAIDALRLYCKIENGNDRDTSMYSHRHEASRRVRMIMNMPSSFLSETQGANLRDDAESESIDRAMSDVPKARQLPVEQLSELASHLFPGLANDTFDHQEFRIPAHNRDAMQELIYAIEHELSAPVVGVVSDDAEFTHLKIVG
jgi:hypothetical protein